MKKIAVLLLGLAVSVACFAQNQVPVFFQKIQNQELPAAPAAQKRDLPASFTSWHLDLPALQQVLVSAPAEGTPAARAKSFKLRLPAASGQLETFAVWEIAMLHPELAARHPYIKTYAGESLSEPGTIVRMSVTARGVHTLVLRPGGKKECVDPCFYGQTAYYIAYDADEMPLGEVDRAQHILKPSDYPLPNFTPYAPAPEERGTLLTPVPYKTYRFAAATTGEFSQDHGGTVASVLSAVTEYTNDISAVYERDMAIRLQLVADNDELIYLNPSTDPFNGNAAPNWADQNVAVTTTIIGSANFDVGHVLCRYMGGGISGIAQIGVVCGSSKAWGATTGTGNGSYGTKFVGTLGQEIGHQFGGGHTWNFCGDATGRNGNTAFEPGSGSTIMSYGGSCDTNNVQGYKDLYFHSGSIEEIRYYVDNGNVSQCGSFTPTDNLEPTVTLSYPSFFNIPIGTPFELNGSATDPDGDALTYCWEEIDSGPAVPLDAPAGSSPLFRTFPAVTETNRYFPRLNTILNNEFDLTEQLPTYTRDMTFRLTARDNQSGGGGVAWADVAFKASAEAGPFVVISPNNSATTWHVGEYVAVNWDVANTDHTPVNCHIVNILLSTDNGQTWPYTLAQATGNDGIQYVLVPDLPTTQARIRVQAADNVFFDVSNAPFSIEQPVQPGFSFSLANDATVACLPTQFETDILTSGVLGFSSAIHLDLIGNLPPGATSSFSVTTLQPGETGHFALDLNAVTVAGDFSFSIRAYTNTGDTLEQTVHLSLFTNDFSALALQTPADGSAGLQQAQTLHWSKAPDAQFYDLQLANSPSFTPASILATKTNTSLDSFTIPFLLEKGKVYYWRVRPVNSCGAHAWKEAFSFSTLVDNCQNWSANDLPLSISPNGSVTVESKIQIGASAIISDINVTQVSGFHDEFGQLEAYLISPAGTQVTLFKNKCGVISVPFNMALDDNSPVPLTCPPSNTGTAVKPQSPLAPLIGQNAQGNWTLRVKDSSTGAGGAVQGFQLQICSSVSLNAPYLVNNNVLSLEAGLNAVISPDLLLTEDANNTHDQLTYTLVTAPQLGHLEKNWSGIMQPGDQFTQADLDNGAIRYFDYGGGLDADYFRFTVVDGEGGYLGTPRFDIQSFSVGTSAPGRRTLDFALAPNPARTQFWVVTGGGAVGSETHIRLCDIHGKVILTANMQAGEERTAIDVATLPAGVYLVCLENEAGFGVKKLLIARP